MYESPSIQVIGGFAALTEKKKGLPVHIYKGGKTGDLITYAGETSTAPGGLVISIS